MTDTATLSEKREELKRQLADGEYVTLLDGFGYRTGRLMQKLTRSTKPIPFWYSTLLFFLLLLMIGLLIASLFDGLNLGQAEFMIYVAVFSYVGFIIFKVHHDILIAHLHHYILDAIESTHNLADLQHWLRLISDKRATIFFAMPFAFLLPLPGLHVLWTLPGNFVGPGLIIQTVLSQIPVGMGIYIVILFFNLPIRLSRYQFRFYSADPASSELVHQLSGMFTVSMYLFATLATVATIVTAVFAIGRLPSIVFLRFIALWAVIAYLFAITQYCLSRIITTAKYKALSGLQAQIEQLWADAKVNDKETRDTLNWLMDYHDRIKATRNSALDVRAILNFVNSLLLPLVAFVLTNLQTIRALFP